MEREENDLSNDKKNDVRVCHVSLYVTYIFLLFFHDKEEIVPATRKFFN